MWPVWQSRSSATRIPAVTLRELHATNQWKQQKQKVFVESYGEGQDCDVHSDHETNCICREEQIGCDAPGRKYTAM